MIAEYLNRMEEQLGQTFCPRCGEPTLLEEERRSGELIHHCPWCGKTFPMAVEYCPPETLGGMRAVPFPDDTGDDWDPWQELMN